MNTIANTKNLKHLNTVQKHKKKAQLRCLQGFRVTAAFLLFPQSECAFSFKHDILWVGVTLSAALYKDTKIMVFPLNNECMTPLFNAF